MGGGSFKIQGGDKVRCFLESPSGKLMIAAVGDNGIVHSLHEFKTTNQENGNLNVMGGEIWSRRGQTPLFERLAIQWDEIIKNGKYPFPKKKKIEIRRSLVGIAMDMSEVEEIIIDYLEKLQEATVACRNLGGVDKQKSGTAYKDPTVILRRKAEDVLIKLVIILRKLPGIVTDLTERKIHGDDRFVSELQELLPEGHPDREHIENDRGWLGELFFLRGQIEHQKWEVDPFEIIPHPGYPSGCDGKDCHISVESQERSPIPLCGYLEVTFSNVFGLIEDAILLSVVSSIEEPMTIARIPDTEAHKNGYARYKLTLTPEFLEKSGFPGGGEPTPPATEQS
jgi:hypothetical protein